MHFRSPSSGQAESYSQEVHNASIALVDEDHSELSRRIAQAFLPPYFQPPQPVAERDIVPLMNSAKYTFVVDIPPNFERDVWADEARDSAQCRRDRDGPGGTRLRLCAADHHQRDSGLPFACGRCAAVDGQSRRARSCSTPTSRRRGSPASWASLTTSPCSPLFSPARRSSASASTAPWIISWSCR